MESSARVWTARTRVKSASGSEAVEERCERYIAALIKLTWPWACHYPEINSLDPAGQGTVS